MKRMLRAFSIIAICVLTAGILAVLVGPGTVHVATMPIIYLCALLAFAVQWLVFVPSYIYQTEHYFDLTGSLTYLLLVAVVLVAVTSVQPLSASAVLVAALVSAWAARLGIFLFRRVKKAGKDGRFDAIKGYWPRFLVTWTLQGLWVFVTLLAGLIAMTTSNPKPLGVLEITGAFLWLSGFAMEVVADRQKSAFNADPRNRGKFINVGLWRWSRHPNYFGEILLWLGIALIAVPVLQGWQWLAMVSPIFVTLLLTRISGVPLLEKRADQKWGQDAAYQQYKRQTPVLVPRFPRSPGV